MAEFGCTQDMPISFWTKSNPFYSERLPLGKIDKIPKQRRHPMPNPDRLAGLTEEEQELYEWELQGNEHPASRDRLRANAFESLAASRATAARRLALLEEFEWIEQVNGLKYCPKCGREECYGHNDPCLLAAELRGGG